MALSPHIACVKFTRQEQHCPAERASGQTCNNKVRGLYGCYCGIHKHLYYAEAVAQQKQLTLVVARLEQQLAVTTSQGISAVKQLAAVVTAHDAQIHTLTKVLFRQVPSARMVCSREHAIRALVTRTQQKRRSQLASRRATSARA